MTILSTDTGQRPDQVGLGTASDGENYTINGALTTSISGNEAVVTGSAGFTSALLGTKTTADIDFTVRAKQINNNFDGVGPTWRSDASGANCYFVALYAGALLFAKIVGGGFTQLASTNISEVNNVFYWIRVVMAGNHLQARAWQDGTSEPSTWNIDTTDSTYISAGRYGMSFNAFGGAGVEFDHITVTDNQSTMSLATHAQATFKVRASMASRARTTFKIRSVLATVTRASFKIRAVLGSLAHATFKIDNVLTQQTPGVATISDTSHGAVVLGDVLVDQASTGDVATGSVTISDQG